MKDYKIDWLEIVIKVKRLENESYSRGEIKSFLRDNEKEYVKRKT